MITYNLLGDQAILIDGFAESDLLPFVYAIRQAKFAWLIDVVPSYQSVGIFFQESKDAEWVIEQIQQLRSTTSESASSRRYRIPCCYDFDLDLPRVAEYSGMSMEEVISNHLAGEYRVYAIGFVPGFPYMGYLPESISGVPRLSTPRFRVDPGSVGITGRQTAIYPLARPGGWNLIGKTPFQIVDLSTGFFPLAVGDIVEFTRIDRHEYARLEAQRLPILTDDTTQ